MDAVTIAKLLVEGGPVAFMGLAIAAWAWERKENKELQKAILALATAQTEAVIRYESSLVSFKELLSAIIKDR